MVGYLIRIVCIFMNTNENIRIKRKSQKNKGYTYKITKILADKCPGVVNMVLNQVRERFLFIDILLIYRTSINL